MAHDPQVAALSLLVAGKDGKAARLAPPFTLGGTKLRADTDAPATPGAHTDEVLREHLGLDEAALGTLRACGAVS